MARGQGVMDGETLDEILARKIPSLFPGCEDSVKELLSRYGVETYEREPQRVRLAILKLSRGEIDRAGDYLEEAKKDYRDVLAWAEYPEQVRAPTWKLAPEENAAMQKRDLEQYEEWLRE